MPRPLSSIFKSVTGLFGSTASKAAKSNRSNSQSSRSSVAQGKMKVTPTKIPRPASLEAETFQSLADQIAQSVAIITEHLKEKNLPEPGFSKVDGPMLPRNLEIKEARQVLNESLYALQALNQYDKFEYIKEKFFAMSQVVAFLVILEYKIPLVLDPKGGPMHIAEICEKANCADEHKLISSLRVLAQLFIFKETEEDYFEHTPFSYELREQTKADFCHSGEILFRSLMEVPRAMKQWPNSSDVRESPFNIAYNTKDTFFEYLWKDAELTRRFNSGMTGITQSSLSYLRTSYPWASLGKGVLCDVGGGRGHVSAEIARVAPELTFIVQDGAPVVEEGEKYFPAELKPRFKFMAHDFFERQPEKADVYLFRQVVHNHEDERAIKMIRNLLPHLKPGKNGSGGRVLIMDDILHPTQFRPPTVQFTVQQNLNMIAILNSKERTFNNYKELFNRADPRFTVRQHGAGGPQACEVVEAWLE